MKVEIEPELAEKLEDLVRRSESIAPVSVESLVNMAVESFIEGAG